MPQINRLFKRFIVGAGPALLALAVATGGPAGAAAADEAPPPDPGEAVTAVPGPIAASACSLPTTAQFLVNTASTLAQLGVSADAIDAALGPIYEFCSLFPPPTETVDCAADDGVEEPILGPVGDATGSLPLVVPDATGLLAHEGLLVDDAVAATTGEQTGLSAAIARLLECSVVDVTGSPGDGGSTGSSVAVPTALGDPPAGHLAAPLGPSGVRLGGGSAASIATGPGSPAASPITARPALGAAPLLDADLSRRQLLLAIAAIGLLVLYGSSVTRTGRRLRQVGACASST